MNHVYDADLFNAVSLLNETVAYETLMADLSKSVKFISQKIRTSTKLPSEIASETLNSLFAEELFKEVQAQVNELRRLVSVVISDDMVYPQILKDCVFAPRLLYYKGNVDLFDEKLIAVVGARKASNLGMELAAAVARELALSGFTVTSGLAAGIDTSAMRSAIDSNGKVVGVIGTPITQSYPRENTELQKFVSDEGLLVSQVPIYRYAHEPFASKKYHFPHRNELMAAMTHATVIVEASDTSGTLTQARACIKLNRPLFISQQCYDNTEVEWPRRYVEQGAYIFAGPDEIINVLLSNEK